MEKNNDVRKMTPMEARTRNLTYTSPFYIELRHYVNEKLVMENKEFYMGRMPVMVKSSLCVADDHECKHDPGGYFICNGTEKTIVMQEKIEPNRVFVFKGKKSDTEAVVHSEIDELARIIRPIRIYPKRGSETPLMISIPYMSSDIPVVIVAKALHEQFDEDEFITECLGNDGDIELLMPSLEEASIVETRQEAIQIIEAKNGKFKFKDIVKRTLYPHLKGDYQACYRLLCEQIKACVFTANGERPIDSRDHMANKRIETAGSLLGMLFVPLYKEMQKKLRQTVNKLLGKNKTINMNRIFTTSIICDGIKYSISTGKWVVKNSHMQGREGVSQQLNRNTYISCISQLRRIDSGVSADQKVVKARLLYGDQMGYKCPAETPEGGPVGLVCQMAMSAYITVQSENEKIQEILSQYISESGQYGVFINNIWQGKVDDTTLVLIALRHARRTRVIPEDASFSTRYGSLYIRTDAGRMCRPLFIVNDGKLMWDDFTVSDLKTGLRKFQDLISFGIVEMIDIAELASCLVAENPNNLTEHHTHMELHPSLILGTMASTQPYPDHNQSPRNCYQASMGKQNMGVYASNYSDRFDSNGHILHNPQKPLATTRASKALCMDELSSGQNAIVAIMTYGGFNQEDSLLVNQSSIDRGLFRATTFRTFDASTNARYGAGETCFGKPKNTHNMNLHDAIDNDGLAPDGTPVPLGNSLIGKITYEDPNKEGSVKIRDESVINKKGNVVVDRTIMFQNEDGGITVKTRVRQQRVPEIGDKFSSRHGQKGTIGMTYCQEDMPFCLDGTVPDIIVNPHAIPSRMTIGHLVECLSSKLGAIRGERIDATAFEHQPVKHIMKLLHESGYQSRGGQRLCDGFTGKMMEGLVFIGPTYYQRLKHLVSDKVRARSQGKVVGLTRQPNEGRAAEGALRFGEMERDCMISHGGANLLHERMCLSSDAYNAPICKHCGVIGTVRKSSQHGGPLICSACKRASIIQVTMPYPSKLLMQELASMGVRPKLVVETKK